MSTRARRWLSVVTLILVLMIPAIPAGAEGSTYTVQAGDTLADIAWRYGTTARAIAQANGLRNVNFIWSGQQLRIPEAVSGSSSATRMHTVQWGDTLAKIARRYGTTVDVLVRANKLANADFIYGGQRLVIPGAGDVAAGPAVTISPASGPSGTSVTVSASGFAASSAVTVWLGPANSEFSEVAQGTTNANGFFSAQVIVQGDVGMNWIFAVNAGEENASSTPFRISGSEQPAVTISPASGPSGTSVTVSASGFAASSAVTVWLGPANSEFSEVARGTADANGFFSTRVVVQGDVGMRWIFAVSSGDLYANSDTFRITGETPPAVTIWPSSGPSGTSVQVSASGFPAHSGVSVWLGPANSEFSAVAQGVTDANGVFSGQVVVQGDPGMSWIFAVNSGDLHAKASPFQITAS